MAVVVVVEDLKTRLEQNAEQPVIRVDGVECIDREDVPARPPGFAWYPEGAPS